MPPCRCSPTSAGCRIALVATLATALLVVLSAAASAHVHATTDDEPHPGTVVLLAFDFDHGCDGQPTDEFAVRLPDGIDGADVEPRERDGWEATVADGVVTWSGGEPVPDHQRHAFHLQVALPDAPGETIHFPTVQRCGDDEVAWIQVPGEGEDRDDLERPAPELTLTDRPAPEPSPEPSREPSPEGEPRDEATAPPDAGEQTTVEPEAAPDGGAADERTAPLLVAGLALLAAVAAGAAALGWRRARGSAADRGTGDSR